MEQNQPYEADCNRNLRWSPLALLLPKASAIGLLGEIFVGGLRAIAPLLVFALVANALSQHQKGTQNQYEISHCPLPPGNFCGSLGSGPGELSLSYYHFL